MAEALERGAHGRSIELVIVDGAAKDKSDVENASSENISQADHAMLPDGGVEAWVTVLGAFLILFCSFGQMNSFGTFQSWYTDHQLRALPPSTISWIGSTQLCVFFLSGGVVGRLFDAYGPRYLLLLGATLLVLGTMMTSLCTEYYQYILAQGIVFGEGVALLFYPSMSAVATHFRQYRSAALGITMTGSGVGGVVYPILFQRLFREVGFAWAVRVSGFISLALCAVGLLTVRSRLSGPRASAPWLDTAMFRDARFVLVVAGNVLISLGIFIPFFYIGAYAAARGIRADTALVVLSAMNGGGILGRLLPPILADAVGPHNVCVPCAFLMGLSALVFWLFAHSLAAVVCFAVVYGFLSGAFIALVVPCVAHITEPCKIGARMGMLYSAVSFSALAGGPAAGAILKRDHGSFTGMIVLCGVANISGSLVLLWARLKIKPHILAKT